MSRIDPADLSVFLAIARTRSFRRAAVDLGVSASALSHALRNIEERLGLRLFNRTTRSVSLTEAGQRLQQRVRPAFDDIEAALEDLGSLRDKPSGTLRINSSRQAAKHVLLPLVTRFLKAYPEVSVDVVVDDGFVDIVAGGFDAGVRLGETLAADMIAAPLGPRQRMVVVGSPAYFKRHPAPASPQDLTGLPCIRFRFRGGEIYRWEFERAGEELSIEVNGPLTLLDMDLMVDAALDGIGLAYVFESNVAELIAKRRLVQVLDDWCGYFPGFFLYYPNRRQHTAAFRAFLEFVRASSPQ
jgi:DNA-binding transcriptional LysR family regulator